MGVSTEGWAIISPAQMRMARAAMGLSLREMGLAVGVSAMAIPLPRAPSASVRAK